MISTEKPRDRSIDEKILDAAKRLFVRFGYDKTTLNDIAHEAGIAKSTLYTRWKKKDDLFGALFWREARRYGEDWFQRIEADPQGGTFAAIYKHAILALQDNAFMLAVYSRDRRVLGAYLQKPEMNGVYEQRIALGIQFMRMFQAVGVVRAEVDPPTAAYLFTSMHLGLLSMHEVVPAEHAPDLTQLLDAMSDMIQRYLAPEGGGDSEAGKTVIRQMIQQIYATLSTLEEKA